MRDYLLVLATVWFIGAAGAVEVPAQWRPDLIVSQATLTKDPTGSFVNKIVVAVTNACGKASAGMSYVLITFKQSSSKDAKAVYYIGNTVKPLKGGETSVQTFNISGQKIGAGTYIYIEVDPYRKVPEANKDNNWRTINPDDAGTNLSPPRCSH